MPDLHLRLTQYLSADSPDYHPIIFVRIHVVSAVAAIVHLYPSALKDFSCSTAYVLYTVAPNEVSKYGLTVCLYMSVLI